MAPKLVRAIELKNFDVNTLNVEIAKEVQPNARSGIVNIILNGF